MSLYDATQCEYLTFHGTVQENVINSSIIALGQILQLGYLKKITIANEQISTLTASVKQSDYICGDSKMVEKIIYHSTSYNISH